LEGALVKSNLYEGVRIFAGRLFFAGFRAFEQMRGFG
jgi:hypothetical protein